jgi:hypothetical protein
MRRVHSPPLEEILGPDIPPQISRNRFLSRITSLSKKRTRIPAGDGHRFQARALYGLVSSQTTAGEGGQKQPVVAHIVHRIEARI